MAKGYEQNQERVRAMNALGKDLARRSRSKCELTLASGVPLRPYEIPPGPPEPDLDHILFVSLDALEQLENPSKLRPDEWRHLADLVWAELPAVQVMALRILQFLATDHGWAAQILADVQPSPEVEEWAASAPLR
ncbi:MAG: phnA protein [Verrucomicrobia bacterium]|nr:phnA protein [Verrucomicrobiota bacterium]